MLSQLALAWAAPHQDCSRDTALVCLMPFGTGSLAVEPEVEVATECSLEEFPEVVGVGVVEGRESLVVACACACRT